MKAASENLVPVTLELGGKSPTIVAKGSVQNRTVSAMTPFPSSRSLLPTNLGAVFGVLLLRFLSAWIS